MKFINEFCNGDSAINWKELVENNSGTISDYIENY